MSDVLFPHTGIVFCNFYFCKLKGFGFDLCCLMTPDLSKDIWCHVGPYFF